MSEESLSSYIVPVHTRVKDAARRLNLPPDASRAQLVSALAASRVMEPALRAAVDDSLDLENVLRYIPPQGLAAAPNAVAQPTGPKIPSRQPRYKIHVHAVLCADDDGTHAVTHTEAELVKLLAGVSGLYFQAGLTFVLSNTTTLHKTVINQDFTIPAGLDYSSEDPPMSDHQIDVSFDQHNAKRSEWAAEHHGELVIFFRYGTKFVRNTTTKLWEVQPATKSFSGPEHEFVAIINEKDLEEKLVAHETGHYFHLVHTFGGLIELTKEEKALYPEPAKPADRDGGLGVLRGRLADAIQKYVDEGGHPAEKGLDVLEVDGLADTPPDPGPAIFYYQNYGNTCGGGSITVDVDLKSGSRPYTVTACLDLLMSYFFRCSGLKRFSELQIDRVRRSLEQVTFTETVTTNGGQVLPVLSRHHLIAMKKPSLPVEIIKFPKRLIRATTRWLRPGHAKA